MDNYIPPLNPIIMSVQEKTNLPALDLSEVVESMTKSQKGNPFDESPQSNVFFACNNIRSKPLSFEEKLAVDKYMPSNPNFSSPVFDIFTLLANPRPVIPKIHGENKSIFIVSLR